MVPENITCLSEGNFLRVQFGANGEKEKEKG